MIPQKYKGSYETTVSIYANKWEDLEEMDKFKEIYNLPILNHEVIEKLSMSITSKDTNE